ISDGPWVRRHGTGLGDRASHRGGNGQECELQRWWYLGSRNVWCYGTIKEGHIALEAAWQMAARVGQQFEQYRLSLFLGQGSFGEVYLGGHIYNNTLAAVKVLQARPTAEDLNEFINEASTTFRLQHPYIVRLLDFGIGP